MLFRDYSSDFGVVGCQQLDPPLANLKTLLDAAATAGLSDDPNVVAAQKVYDDANGYVVFLPIGGDCDAVTSGVTAAIVALNAFLKSTSTPIPPVPFPTYKQPAPGSSLLGLPGWVEFVLVAGVLAYGLTAASKFVPLLKGSGSSGPSHYQRAKSWVSEKAAHVKKRLRLQGHTKRRVRRRR